ncbi:uncharacterized protein LOC115624092 [Scaptodrosophila lebanonensis]|uniref:Uncharacterized protein LOC115624092 n=1 Tax=Drosophila lebanonensis TaxID=7225 RepID=A0A6J2THP8_DROLE|nr:uncharacterized protein LOC115624092 [Scaptodrosophila lebanonensis]
MHKSQKGSQCWTLLLLSSLIMMVLLGLSYWWFVPHQQTFWSVLGSSSENTDGPKFYFPPRLVPKELKLRREQPFIYQILH